MNADPENPEVLVSVPSEIEAAAIVTALAEEGIEATATGGFTAGFRAEAPGLVNVLVRGEDYATALKVLENFRQHGAGVDWSQIDVGEPEEE